VDQLGDVVLLRRFGRDPVEVAAVDAWVDAVQAVHSGPIAVRWGRDTVRLVGDVPDAGFEVVEDGLTFEVDVHRGSNVGLFPDARPMRRWVRERSEGLRVLNLFSYTSAFGVHAAAGGARSVTNVDLVPSALERGAANFSRNDLPCDSRTHVRSDAFEFLRHATKRGETWDLVVVDPPPVPTIGRGRKRGGRRGRFDPRKDWPALATGAAACAAGGRLLVLSAARGLDGFETLVTEALPEMEWTELSRGEDFPGPRDHGLRALAGSPDV
jgi:23S rRNA (cytosine1962-C5)-methyltransferase